MTLNEFAHGHTLRIVRLCGTGPVKRRIMDMGLTKGVTVYIRKVAPLGDPMELNVRGYELSLRKADAAMIEVEEISDRARGKEKTHEDNRTRRQSQLRQNDFIQPAHRCTPVHRQLARVTVEKKEGPLRNDSSIRLQDLPCIYSLSPTVWKKSSREATCFRKSRICF